MFISKRKHNDLLAQQAVEWQQTLRRETAKLRAKNELQRAELLDRLERQQAAYDDTITVLEERTHRYRTALERILVEPNRPGILRTLRNIAEAALDAE